MKNILLLVLLITAISVSAQKKTTPVNKPKTTTTSVLKNINDSASYAIGLSVANFYSQQGLTKLNASVVARAISDVLNNKKALLTDQAANDIIMRYMNDAQSAKAKPNITAGEKFLAQNKLKAGVKTTASGLQYEVIKEGTGVKPSASDTVVAHYAGKLLNGTEFENSYKRGEPLTIAVSRVIRGWTEALQLMSVGSKYRLYIPYELGYGLNDMGAIPAGSLLIFEVELLDIKKG
jgi:FKBP-type peptidyl-prolyl cis-trans isomerase FklB